MCLIIIMGILIIFIIISRSFLIAINKSIMPIFGSEICLIIAFYDSLLFVPPIPHVKNF